MRLSVRVVLSTAVALSLSGCKTKEEPAAQARSSATSPAPHSEAPKDAEPADGPSGVRDDGSVITAVRWFSGTLEEALAQATREGKLVFVDVGAYWCPPCHRYDEEVFTLAEVGAFLADGYVAVHVDAEKGEGPELVDRYKVQAYPTLLVLEPSGIEKGRVVDFVPAKELEAALERIARGQNVLAELEAAVESDPDDLEKRYRLGHGYALAARREEAEKHYAVVTVGDPADEMGLASSVAYDRTMFFTHKLDGDLEGAIAQYRALQRKYPDSKAALRAYRQIGRLQHLLGRSDEASASLDQMLAADPGDPTLVASYGWFSFRERCRPERGLEVVEAGIEQHPDDPELHYLRAELQHLVGNEAAALGAIRKASALEPDSAFYKRQVRRFIALTGSSG